MNIKILGAGCQSCMLLTKNTEAALNILNIDANIIEITDMEEVMKYGTMLPPALVINEKVVSYGKILTEEEISELIKENM